jgi:hypothetical protein
MRLFRHKRGTDKPIEIFVALFIILAVAMVILQMFSKQISGKTKELKQMEQEQKLKQDLQRAQQLCAEKCTNALENDCSDVMRAQFCITYIKDFKTQEPGLDLNGNGIMTDYNAEVLGGIGVCEDKVYCPQLIDCTCKQVLTMAQCKEILCQYWSNQGIEPNSALDTYFDPGKCFPNLVGIEQQSHWYYAMGSGSSLTCT